MLRGLEVAVARAHGEAVRFSHGFACHDFYGEIQLPRHFAQDEKLLEILFAEYGDLRPDDVEELGHYGTDTAKMPRPYGPAKLAGDCRRFDLDGLRLGVEFGIGGRKHHVGPGCGEFVEIGLQSTRIAGQIFVGAELQRVDENAHHYALAQLPRLFDQRDMPGVQVAHGGDEGDAAHARQPGT